MNMRKSMKILSLGLLLSIPFATYPMELPVLSQGTKALKEWTLNQWNKVPTWKTLKTVGSNAVAKAPSLGAVMHATKGYVQNSPFIQKQTQNAVAALGKAGNYVPSSNAMLGTASALAAGAGTAALVREVVNTDTNTSLPSFEQGAINNQNAQSAQVKWLDDSNLSSNNNNQSIVNNDHPQTDILPTHTKKNEQEENNNSKQLAVVQEPVEEFSTPADTIPMWYVGYQLPEAEVNASAENNNSKQLPIVQGPARLKKVILVPKTKPAPASKKNGLVINTQLSIDSAPLAPARLKKVILTPKTRPAPAAPLAPSLFYTPANLVQKDEQNVPAVNDMEEPIQVKQEGTKKQLKWAEPLATTHKFTKIKPVETEIYRQNSDADQPMKYAFARDEELPMQQYQPVEQFVLNTFAQSHNNAHSNVDNAVDSKIVESLTRFAKTNNSAPKREDNKLLNTVLPVSSEYQLKIVEEPVYQLHLVEENPSIENEQIEKLLEKESAVDTDGNTALHRAVIANNEQMVRDILKPFVKNADLVGGLIHDIKDKANKSAAELAIDLGHIHLWEIMIESV